MTDFWDVVESTSNAVEHECFQALPTAGTELAAAERNVERRSRRYQLVAEAIGEVIYECDFATATVEWSGPMGDAFHYRGDESATLAWWISKVHPDDRSRVESSFAAAVEGTATSWSGVYRFIRGDGKIAHVRDRCFFSRDARGRAISATGAMHDITELHELEQRLAIADRITSIGTLAAGLAHEINNPLTYVLGNLEMLLDDIGARIEPEAAEMLREAHQGAVRVSEIVRTMRMFGRTESADAKTADVDRAVESALAMAKNELRHRARLVKQLGAPPRVAASGTMLVQVVLNLLINAVQAISHEGQVDKFEIAVTTGTDPSGRAFIEVRDTGEGMTPETMRRMFDPFFTTKGVGQGMGLGLSVVHSAVSASGGEISVASAPGQGSTFRVLLPVAPATGSPSTEASGGGLRPAGGRILIADDEASVVRLLRRMLIRDHEILVAASGREALELLIQDNDFDVVLCDVMMPDLTGADLHREIARQSPSLAQRFVFLTGGAFGEHARTYVQSTEQPTIDKPFRSEAVAQAIERVRRRGKLARELELAHEPGRARHAS